MIFEILSTASMLGVSGAAYVMKHKKGSKDHEKIVRIAENAGLTIQEGKEKKTIQLYKRRSDKNYTEYIYRIPLGLSFKQFEDKKQTFIDGLNNKTKQDFSLEDLKTIDFKKPLNKELQRVLNKRSKINKHLEMEYDGMLKFRVYDKGLDTEYPFTNEMAAGLKAWEIPVGYTYRMLMKHDFEKRPHVIVAGTTGFGKSEFLKMIIAVLIMMQPDNVKLNLIDLKGGAELGPFKDLKQTKTFARIVPEAEEVLEDVQDRMNKKLDWLFEKGFKDVKEAGQKEREFVVIDEAGDLNEDCKDIVVDIARRGRAAGFRLIYATQYPTNETLPSQVRANIGPKICFRLETNAQSRAVLDEGGAEELPEIEGRAIFRRVKNYIIQAPLMSKKQINDIINPHIVKKQREGVNHGFKAKETVARGTHIVKFEEI